MQGVDAPADGVVTGYGRIDGRLACVAAYDFTVMAGSMGATGEQKVTRLREIALTKRIPFVWLLDSAGARIQEAAGSLFAGTGQLFREEVVASGVIPQVAALMGPCAAGTAYIPALADFVPMVSGRGSMALAGPHLVKAVTGEEVTQEELGGAKVHCRVSGVGDIEVASDEECIETIKRYLSFFPQNCEQRPPVRDSATRRIGGRRSCSTCSRTRAASPTTCTRSSSASSTTASTSTSRGASGAASSRASHAWAGAGGDRRQSAQAPRRDPRERLRRQGRALHQPLQRVRHPARLPPGRPRLHGRDEGRGRGHHPPRREDALRSLERDRPEDHR